MIEYDKRRRKGSTKIDEWLCRNSWITRDENNRQALAELRSILMSKENSLIPILKEVPKGTVLYSPIYGEVKFKRVDEKNGYIEVMEEYGLKRFRHDGTYLMRDNAECLLFPSKECRDWSKFKLNNIG